MTSWTLAHVLVDPAFAMHLERKGGRGECSCVQMSLRKASLGMQRSRCADDGESLAK